MTKAIKIFKGALVFMKKSDILSLLIVLAITAVTLLTIMLISNGFSLPIEDWFNGWGQGIKTVKKVPSSNMIYNLKKGIYSF